MLSQVLAVAPVHAVPGPRPLPTGRPGATTTWLPPRRAGARGLTIGIVSVPRGVRQSPGRRSLSGAQLPTPHTLSGSLGNIAPVVRDGRSMAKTHFARPLAGFFDRLSGRIGIPASVSDRPRGRVFSANEIALESRPWPLQEGTFGVSPRISARRFGKSVVPPCGLGAASGRPRFLCEIVALRPRDSHFGSPRRRRGLSPGHLGVYAVKSCRDGRAGRNPMPPGKRVRRSGGD